MHKQSAFFFLSYSSQQAKLEELQRRQKEIEEQNKQKKAALQKTIQERFQRSQRETAVLKKVKGELFKLDNAVTSDVSILRDAIDQASREYTTAKRRYDAAEAEFVAAKLDLFKKSERKEMLTQHLYTIIQEVELRKAKRLEDLTKDLATVESEGGLDSMKDSDTANTLSKTGVEDEKIKSLD
jgi:RAB6-interacting golgin